MSFDWLSVLQPRHVVRSTISGTCIFGPEVLLLAAFFNGRPRLVW
jgi:hypothetical protein